MKPPSAIGSDPNLSGHAIAYRWRSLPRVRRHRASSPKGSSSNGCCLCRFPYGPINVRLSFPTPTFFSFFSFISLIADGPHHYHLACGHKGSSHLSPVHALQFFYRDASSALLQLVNQWLNFTYSRSHAFRYERKNTNPTAVGIELTTSVLADVQLTY